MNLCCVGTQKVVNIGLGELSLFNDTISITCKVTGTKYCGGISRRERKRRKSERQFVARKGSLTSVINSTIGQISRSLEAANPHKQECS